MCPSPTTERGRTVDHCSPHTRTPHIVQYLTICSSTSNITSNYSPNPLKLEPNKCSSPPPPTKTPYSLVPLSIAVNSVLKWGAENMILDRRRKRCFGYGKT